jgi:cytosine/adenosine deaminase-related metal-dependent hydrolase
MKVGSNHSVTLNWHGAAPAREPPLDVERADLIIRNGTVITMNPNRDVFPSGSVVVRGSRILAVGDAGTAEGYRAERVLDARGGLVLPGFVNSHTHVSMAPFRGLADDVEDRLRRFIFPLEKALVDRELVHVGALHGSIEMARSGVTTFADMYYFEDEVARAAKQVGLRAVLGETVIGFPAPDAASPAEALAHAEAFIGAFEEDPLITPALAPHAPHTLESNWLRAVERVSAARGVPVLIHLGETEAEVESIRSRTGLSPVAYLDRLGLLNERLTAAHCIFVDPEDIALLRSRHVGVAHNMVANAKSAKGVAPVPRMLDEGLRVGLGTDGPMSGNSLDIIGQMGYVAKIHKLILGDPTALPSADVVALATIGGARALHMEDRIGSLEPGKLADIVVIRIDSPAMAPIYDVYSALVYAANARDVRTTIVHGQAIVDDGKLRNVNEMEVRNRIEVLAQRVRSVVGDLERTGNAPPDAAD